ncbi:hypothetical protein IMZ48_01155, partial [Candidatus Bathyarchaeota archaeon]|nr:hypothetical protein [Candidatus Bathyarchaeota archaeon]
GLANLFTFHGDQIVLQDIVNKTNIAEAKAGISLVDVNMEEVVKDEDFAGMKKEGSDEDGGIGQLAALITAEDKKEFLAKKNEKPKSDAIQAILSSAGVEYTHENSEVVGSSKVEQQLSRRAELAGDEDDGIEGDSALFAGSLSEDDGDDQGYLYNPPEEVMRRQFCSMAREFGFSNATEFALVVEGMTQAERRNCLDTFYKKRAALLGDLGTGTPKPEPGVEREASGPAGEGYTRVYGTSGPERVKDEVKDTKVKVKAEDEGWDFAPAVKSEKAEPGVKREINTGGAFAGYGIKAEFPAEVKVKVEGGKRTTVFLSDDDDDDEL